MFTDVTSRFDAADINANKGVAAVANIPVLFWLPLLACPKSPFARFGANNGLLLLVLLLIGCPVLRWVPLFGKLLSNLLGLLVFLAAVYCLVMAAQGRAKKLPLIGDFEILK